MADQRLKEIMKNTNAAHSEGCPILLEARALYIDTTNGNGIAQLKWMNIGEGTVKAVKILLDMSDAFGQKLDTFAFQYSGISVPSGSEFGNKTPIILQNNKAEMMTVIVEAVSFTDGTVWVNQKGTACEALPETVPQDIKGELYNRLADELSKLKIERAVKM